MSRFEDTPALFGVQQGMGTYADISCQWCGTDFTGREGEDGEAISTESICVDHFGKKQICDCCFAELEEAIIRNMPRILPWYFRLLKSRKANLESLFGNMQNIKDILAELSK